MTFLEAAIEILKRERQPLHYKKLSEIAVQQNLLTVVGRTPELTMQQRLNDALKKSDPALLLTREKPGVYGLRYYPPSLQSGDDGAGAQPPTPPAVTEAAPVPATADAAAEPDVAESTSARPGTTEEAGAGEDRKRRRRRGGRGRRGAGEGADATLDAAAIARGQDLPVAEKKTEESPEVVDAGATAASGSVEVTPPQRAPAPTVEESADARADARLEEPAVVAEREPASAHAAPMERPAEVAEATAEAPVDWAAVEPPATPAVTVEHPTRETPPPAIDEPVAAAPSPEVAALQQPEEEGLFDELEAHRGPVIAPAFGTEEIVRGEEHRPVYDESKGRSHRGHETGRPQRRPARHGAPGEAPRPEVAHDNKVGADTRRGGGRPHEARHTVERPAPAARPESRAPEPRAQARPVETRPAETRPAETRPAETRPAETRPTEARPAAADRGPRVPSLVDAVIDVLRGGDARPMHIRQIVDIAIKRRLMRGDASELWRTARIALFLDTRARETLGLRARVRGVGGSHYVLLERKLDGELATEERVLAEQAARVSESSRVALRRRLGRLPAPAFETIARLLLERMGLGDAELVKRGEGVAYLGGALASGGRSVKLLVAVRPGEAELPRRAVAELRAGLAARGFERGLLLTAGRLAPDARTEWMAAGPTIDVRAGDDLAAVCAAHGVGLVRQSVIVDVLDVELLGEIAEA